MDVRTRLAEIIGSTPATINYAHIEQIVDALLREFPQLAGWRPIDDEAMNGREVDLVWNTEDWTTGRGFYRSGQWIVSAAFYKHSAGWPPFEYREHVVRNPVYYQPRLAPPADSQEE